MPGQIAIGRTSNTPNILGAFSKDAGQVTTITNGANYFAGFTQVDDPLRNTVGGPQNQQSLRTAFTNKPLVDANGNLVLTYPDPGKVGTLGRTSGAPGSLGLYRAAESWTVGERG